MHAEAPSLTPLHQLSKRTASLAAKGVPNPRRCWGHHSPLGGLAPMAEPSSPSPAGAEQPCFSLGSWHATRASPLPIRPPAHAHPSPIQTLSAINKQWKCQPAPGKSPRQLHPIWQAQEGLPHTVLVGASTQGGPGHSWVSPQPPRTWHPQAGRGIRNTKVTRCCLGFFILRKAACYLAAACPHSPCTWTWGVASHLEMLKPCLPL